MHKLRERSLPLRERGLKFNTPAWKTLTPWSLPLRERGLKFAYLGLARHSLNVAPFTGAWIEIYVMQKKVIADASLPLRERGLKCNLVAAYGEPEKSLPLRERGLKLEFPLSTVPLSYMSLPLRERGLKYDRQESCTGQGSRSLYGSVD